MTKRLFIIGNGFDRYHGINSSYYDFRDWMRENIHYDGEEIERLFECDDLWRSFEENLSLLRYDVLAREKTEENPPNIASSTISYYSEMDKKSIAGLRLDDLLRSVKLVQLQPGMKVG